MGKDGLRGLVRTWRGPVLASVRGIYIYIYICPMSRYGGGRVGGENDVGRLAGDKNIGTPCKKPVLSV